MRGYIIIYLCSVFLASVSQVLLKKAAMKQYDNVIKEYLNPLVIFAYALFFSTTVMGVIAYKVVPISLGPVLEATSYIYITIFGVIIFKEHLTVKKIVALCIIICGILVYGFLG